MKISNLPPVSQPLPWHDYEWRRLINQRSEGRLPHALILVGREHIGKSQFALALSRLLLCAQPEETYNCGKCHACELSASGNHGDLRWVEPAEGSRIIKIDQIRDLMRFTSTTAGLGARKIVVIAAAEKMNINAFNSLLKVLEEPATNTYIVLVCNHMQSVPATIRSRCQLHKLPTPDKASCLEWLGKITSAPQRSESLLEAAGGLPLLAERLFRSDQADSSTIKRHAMAALISQRISVPEVALMWNDLEIGHFLEFLVGHLQSGVCALSAEELKTSRARAMFALVDEVQQLQRATISGANPNKQLLLTGLLSKYQRELGRGLRGDNIPKQSGGVRA